MHGISLSELYRSRNEQHDSWHWRFIQHETEDRVIRRVLQNFRPNSSWAASLKQLTTQMPQYILLVEISNLQTWSFVSVSLRCFSFSPVVLSSVLPGSAKVPFSAWNCLVLRSPCPLPWRETKSLPYSAGCLPSCGCGRVTSIVVDVIWPGSCLWGICLVPCLRPPRLVWVWCQGWWQ